MRAIPQAMRAKVGSPIGCLAFFFPPWEYKHRMDRSNDPSESPHEYLRRRLSRLREKSFPRLFPIFSSAKENWSSDYQKGHGVLMGRKLVERDSLVDVVEREGKVKWTEYGGPCEEAHISFSPLTASPNYSKLVRMTRTSNIKPKSFPPFVSTHLLFSSFLLSRHSTSTTGLLPRVALYKSLSPPNSF